MMIKRTCRIWGRNREKGGPFYRGCQRGGFSLTELLIVIGILALLFGIIIAFYTPSQEQRKVFECQSRLSVLHRAFRLYILDWESFPASPYDALDNDGDGQFDEDPLNGADDDNDGAFDEDPFDAFVGGLWTLQGYLRSRRSLLCPSDRGAITGGPTALYSSYQGCDTGTRFLPPVLPVTGQQACPQGVPTYALARFPVGHDCHPSSRNFDRCPDPDRFRQLAVRNSASVFPGTFPSPNLLYPADDTVVTWCVHHRYMPESNIPNYTKGKVPADIVLYWDGSVRLQQMRLPSLNWRRRPTEP